MKEMVGGCCVCSDERGWPENPLVYCDGQNCTVAVHQACYGIVTVPTGPWYCRKCESQERAARVRCELCPSRDGALKKTDNHGWAHVVCALYIPEVRFGNVTTMEPIILQLIPHERYSKTCYICQEIGKGSKAHVGACMQCNKTGCKQQFHVTCAQALGLLCEEAGNYLDNVKYCGYCQHHYSKLKKGGNVKTIPPYKPVTNETGSSDPSSSPEKESESLPSSHHNTASTSASLKAITTSTSYTTSATASGGSNTNPTVSVSSLPTGTNLSSAGSSTTTASVSTTKLRKSGGSGGSSSKSSSGSTPSVASTQLPTGSSPTAPTGSGASSHGHSSNTMRSQSNSSGSAKEKEGKYTKNTNKGSSNKNHDKEPREKSSKSGSSSKGSHKENSSMDTSSAPLVPPIIVSSAMLSNTTKDQINSPTTMISTKEAMAQKFTTSNFTETVVVNSESVFGADVPNTSAGKSVSPQSGIGAVPSTATANSSSSSTVSLAKKRKVDASKGLQNTNADEPNNRDLIKDVSVTLVPLPAMDRMDVSDDKNSKKQKTTDSSLQVVSPLRIVHEPNLQNLSPNLPLSAGAQKHQSSGGQHQSGNSSGSTYSIQPPLSKLPTNESRLQGIQQQTLPSNNANSNSSNLSQTSNIAPASQPSLVVSVPLSTANVPGVSLPPNSSATIVQLSHHQQQQQNYPNTAYQRISDPTNTQHRLSPNINPGSSTSNPHSQQQQQQPTPQQHQTVLKSHHQSKGRHSPVVLSNSQFHSVPTTRSSVSPAAHSLANITPVPNNDHCSPISVLPSPSGSASAVTLMDTDSGGLKFGYEKQPNSRVVQLQDDSQATTRRSRSQLGTENLPKTRNSKKRSAPSSTASLSSQAFNMANEKSETTTKSPIQHPPSKPQIPTNSNNASSSSAFKKQHQPNAPVASTSNQLTNNPTNQYLASANGTANGSDQANPNLHHSNHSSPLLVNNASESSHGNTVALPPLTTTNTTTTKSSVHHLSHPKKLRTQSIDSTPSTSSRTPDNVYSATGSSASANSFGGLKFGYETQTPAASITATNTASSTNVTPSVTPQPQPIKDSPPSSPGSEAGSARKRNRPSTDTKDFKIFNGVHVSHMLGNQLNPASSVAQKMSDQLHMELEAHSVYTSSSLDSASQLTGPPFPGKQQAQIRSAQMANQSQGPPSLSSMLGGNGTPTAAGNTPQSLEQLLERQWEQGSQFLMEQAQHFDIASLLSCLHQLRTENVRLEDHVTNLVARRDHLLAVNARLAIPLNPPVPQTSQGSFNHSHTNGPTNESTHPTGPGSANTSVSGISALRNNNLQQQQQQPPTRHHFSQQQQQHLQQQPQQPHTIQQQQHQPIENGIDFRHGPSTHSMSSGSAATTSTGRPCTSHTHPQQPQQPHHIYGQQHQAISNNNTSNSLGNRQPPQPQQQQHHLPHQQPPIILQHHQHQQSSTVASSQNTTGGSSNPTGNPSNDPNQMRGRISSASGSGTCSTSQQQLPSVGYPNPSSHHPHQSSRRGDDKQVKPS